MEVGVAPARFRLTRRRFSLQCLASLMMAGPSLPSPAAQVHRGSASRRSAFQRARLLRRGINLGNMLDAPEEGAWGVRLKAEYFYVIARAGFGSVRIPIRWSAHAEVTPPYRIDPAFLRRVDWAIRQALSRGLVAVIDVHHYAEMNLDPPGHLPRLTSLWTQIAEHYRNWPNGLFFELLNEPEGKLTDERWSEIVPHLLRAVRESNARRMVVVGPAHQYAATSLDRLNLPENDPYLIAPSTTIRRYASRIKGQTGSRAARPGGGQAGKARPRSGVRSRPILTGLPHGQREATGPFMSRNSAPIRPPIWTRGGTGRPRSPPRRRGSASSRPIGSSAPPSALTIRKLGPGGSRCCGPS